MQETGFSETSMNLYHPALRHFAERPKLINSYPAYRGKNVTTLPSIFTACYTFLLFGKAIIRQLKILVENVNVNTT
jgi:hypothetical protein